MPRAEVLVGLRDLVRGRARGAHDRERRALRPFEDDRGEPFASLRNVGRSDARRHGARACGSASPIGGPSGTGERIIDLSHEAAKELGVLKAGVTRVKLTILSPQ